MIKNMKDEIERMQQQHPTEWKNAHTGNAHTEDFIRLTAKHLNSLDGRIGLNGKRGNPDDISDDVVNVLGEGPGIEKLTGRPCSIFDVIEGAGGPNPKASWNLVPDDGSNGAWVNPFSGPVVVVPTPSPFVLSRAEFMDEGFFLHKFYIAQEGLQRVEGLWKPTPEFPNGAPDFEGIGAWLFDVYQMARMHGKSREEARRHYIEQIEGSGEWKSKHPGR